MTLYYNWFSYNKLVETNLVIIYMCKKKALKVLCAIINFTRIKSCIDRVKHCLLSNKQTKILLTQQNLIVFKVFNTFIIALLD